MAMTERIMIIIMMMMAMVMMKTMLTMKITVAIIKQKNIKKHECERGYAMIMNHVHAKMSLRANRSFDILTACSLLTC